MRILTVNAGSSTLKLSLIGDGDETLHERELAAPDATVGCDELDHAIGESLGQADAVAHRIVHGGHSFREAVVVDAQVRRELGELVDLAPLHQPKSIAGLDAVSALLPGVPAVACFDTAFHATMPPAAFTYALPSRWRERWGLRKFGFHGLSHAWIARRVNELVHAEPDPRRVVSCHLGSGASLCAILDGKSIDTTMGFTPLDGLVMSTRSGSVDPGMLLWLLEREAVDERQLAESLEHHSGLAGLAATPDMREVLRQAAAGIDTARLAVDVYLHRLRSSIAAMSAAIEGLDVLAFTGGVGEHRPEIRAGTAERLQYLGVAIDPRANRERAADAEITLPGAKVRTLVLRAREDLEMARQARAALAR